MLKEFHLSFTRIFLFKLLRYIGLGLGLDLCAWRMQG